MIVTKFYKGQGLGNQLWVYAVLRSLAWNHKYDYGIESFYNFKLPNFIHIQPGKRVFGLKHERPYGLRPVGIREVLFENQSVSSEMNFVITNYEERVAELKDRTKIEGYFQSARYIENYRDIFTKMFRCEVEFTPRDDTCYINVRGGDYVPHKDICCDIDYYQRAVLEMQKIGISKFVIVTDDRKYAENLLPGIQIASSDLVDNKSKVSDEINELKIATDFSMLQNARYLILSNSTFAWWAAWTNIKARYVIAPRYWSHPRNPGKLWSPAEIAVGDWQYCDGESVITGQDALLESSIQTPNFNNKQVTIKAKIDVIEKIKVFLYKHISSLIKWGKPIEHK